VRRKEGLEQAVGLLRGEEPPAQLIIDEHGVKIAVDVRHGHKTGFYLDQAENRHLLHTLITQEARAEESLSVLNLFSYSGGFALHALKAGGVHAVSVDSSHEALELAEANVALNGIDAGAHTAIQADVFQYLRDMAQNGQQHDILVLDPPKFAHTQQQIDKAARGYKDINLNALKLIKSGGYLFTFSCSGAITRDLFQKIVFGALEDSGREAQIVRHLSQSADHPIALTFPEGEYLKGLLLRVF
jgi:23S rRNA (cytosine1962-C5)-methyltransferase